MSEISDWFQSLPFFTRYWFGLSVALPLLGRIGLLTPYYMVLLWEPTIYQFQLWRPLTSVFYYPITPQTGFHFLTNLYFIYSYSIRLETGMFDGRPADYFFMLLFMWANCVLVGLLMGLILLMDSMVMAVLYVWSQLNKDVVVTFWFGLQFKAMYLPWVLFVFKLVLAGDFMNELAGILIGHLYFFLEFKYPLDFNGPSFLKTPQFLYRYFPGRQGGGGGRGSFGQPPPQAARQQAPAPAPGAQGRHTWGQGHILGGQ